MARARGLVLVFCGLVLLVGCGKSPPPVAKNTPPAAPSPPSPPPPQAPAPPAPATPEAPPAAPAEPGPAVAKSPAAPGTAPAPAPAGPAQWEAYAARAKHPLANAQVGDYASYTGALPDLGGGNRLEMRMRLSVKSRTSTEVVLSRDVSGARQMPSGEITFDLTQPLEMAQFSLTEPSGKAEANVISRGPEVFRSKQFAMPCEKIVTQVTAGKGDVKIKSEITTWCSSEAPLLGLAAMEMNLLGLKIKLVLDTWGPDHPGPLRELPGAKLTKNESPRLSFDVGGQPLEISLDDRSVKVLDQAGKAIESRDLPRYLTAGNVFRVSTVLRANAESLGELKLEQGGPASIAQVVAALPRKVGGYGASPPQIAPAMWELTLSRAEVGDWVAYRDKAGDRLKYREVTEVTEEQVTMWEVYNLDNLYSHGLRFTLDSPEPAKAKTAKKTTPEKSMTEKKTTSKTSTTSKTPKKTSSTSKPTKKTAQPKPTKQPEPTPKKPEPAEPEKPEPMEPEPRVVGTETITLMGKPVECEVVEFPTKSGRGVEAKLWISADVPLDGVVRREEKGKVVYLLEEFGTAR